MDRALFDSYIPNSLAWLLEDNLSPQTSDASIVAACVVGLIVLRPLLDKFVFLPIAWKFTPKDEVKPASTPSEKDKTFAKEEDNSSVTAQAEAKKGKKKDKKECTQEETVDKFKESLWKFSFYGLSWTLGFFLAAYYGYLTDFSAFWPGYPAQEFSWLFRFYFISSFAFYIHSCITIPMETKRDDRTMLMIHHVVTIILMYVAYTSNLLRIGSMTVILHDFCDIFLEMAKMMNYAKFTIGANVSFATFAIGWVATRLTAFPVVIYHFAVVYSTEIDPEMQWVTPIRHKTYIAFLLALVVMHIIWSVSIVKVLGKVLKGEGEDVRENKKKD